MFQTNALRLITAISTFSFIGGWMSATKATTITPKIMGTVAILGGSSYVGLESPLVAKKLYFEASELYQNSKRAYVETHVLNQSPVVANNEATQENRQSGKASDSADSAAWNAGQDPAGEIGDFKKGVERSGIYNGLGAFLFSKVGWDGQYTRKLSDWVDASLPSDLKSRRHDDIRKLSRSNGFEGSTSVIACQDSSSGESHCRIETKTCHGVMTSDYFDNLPITVIVDKCRQQITACDLIRIAPELRGNIFKCGTELVVPDHLYGVIRLFSDEELYKPRSMTRIWPPMWVNLNKYKNAQAVP
jgi:hypothetical protein